MYITHTIWKEGNNIVVDNKKSTMENIAGRVAGVCCVKAIASIRLLFDRYRFKLMSVANLRLKQIY